MNLTGLHNGPDLNHIQHLWDELHARPYHRTSMSGLTNALVAEWQQIPAAMLQNLVESFSRGVEAVIATHTSVHKRVV